MSNDRWPVKILPDLFLVAPGHQLFFYSLRGMVYQAGDIPGIGKIQGILSQDLSVKSIIVCGDERLAGHGFQQGWVGPPRAVPMKIKTGEEFQVMDFLLVINDPSEQYSFIMPEFMLQVFTEFIGSVADHQDFFAGVTCRKSIEDGLDIIFWFHTGH